MKKSTLRGLCGILLSGVIAGGICACGYASRNNDGKWFKNGDMASWHWSDKSDSEQKNQSQLEQPQTEIKSWGGVVDDIGNDLNAGSTYAMPRGVSFYGTPRATNGLENPSITISCSHNFEYNNVFVDWKLVDASGNEVENSTVTVTPTEDGSLTANVSCSAPFETQLTLKVTERGNAENSATCTLDYVRRITSVTDYFIGCSDFDDPINFGFKPTYGKGTVDSLPAIKSTRVMLDSGFKTHIQSYLKFSITFKDLVMTDIVKGMDYRPLAYSDFIEGFDNYDDAHKKAIYYAWWSAFNNGDYMYNMLTYDYEIEARYNGNVINHFAESDMHRSKACYISGEVYGDSLTPDLTLNNTSANF